MEKWKAKLYRLSLRALPLPSYTQANEVTGDFPQAEEIVRILRAHRVVGATVALFDEKGMTGALCAGHTGKEKQITGIDTVYRIASVTKHVVALALMRLQEEGRIDLDADVDAYLPCSLRHPKAPDLPVTLRRLMSHTAGIRDGEAYVASFAGGKSLSEVMRGDCFADAPDQFEYSNLGAGIIACVLEGMLKQSFEKIMNEALFAPLNVKATFFPQKVTGALADAWRVLPPARQAGYDAVKRRAAPLPDQKPDPDRHYLWAQGNLCITAEEMAKIGAQLLQERYAPMRKKIASFGVRAYNLDMGLGTFIVNDAEVCSQTLYGHQGLAYGAVHGLFYDPGQKRGVVILTSGCSEARDGVLADINKAIMKRVFR
ncbi:MAG: beta-lactamase family protein [Clostridia bacterium]|nr:beta-lactamase family protein [Clostridia bacterium]